MPIVFARVAYMGFGAIHSNIKTYAPFMQLSDPAGAPASVLFGASFSSTWYSWVGWGAVTLMTPFAAESIFFDSNYDCPNPDYSNPVNPCWPPRMSINPSMVRLLQGLAGIVGVTSLIAAYKSMKKPSGVTADPTTIASVAALMGHPDIARDFQHLDSEATTKEAIAWLKKKRYRLDNYYDLNGAQRYGLVPVKAEGAEGAEEEPAPELDNARDLASSSSNNSKFLPYLVWKAIATYIDGIFLLFVVAVLGICASYVKDVNNSPLAKLFEYSSIGRRLVFTAIGMIASSQWGRLLEGNFPPLCIVNANSDQTRKPSPPTSCSPTRAPPRAPRSCFTGTPPRSPPSSPPSGRATRQPRSSLSPPSSPSSSSSPSPACPTAPASSPTSSSSAASPPSSSWRS
jgi:hypothetical protein